MKKIYIITVSVITISIAFFAYNFFTHQKTQETEAAPSKTGLIGYWSMDNEDINGTTVYDRSEKGNNGVLTASPTSIAGKLGQAQTFNGTIDISSNLLTSTTFSISSWININSLADDTEHVIVGQYDTGDGRLLFEVDARPAYGNDSLRLFVGGTGGVDLQSSTKIVAGNWYFVSVVADGGNATLYINGKDEGSNTFSLIPLNTNTQIGGENLLASAGLRGYIDEVRIYEHALSAQEISQLYNSTKTSHATTPKKTGLIGYWNMDNESINGTTVLDNAENNHGTSANTPTILAGKIGQAMSFNGSSDYVTLPYTPKYQFTTSMGIGGWAYRSDWNFATDEKLISNTEAGGYQISFNAAGGWEGKAAILARINGSYIGPGILLSSLSPGWHHFFGTYDGRYLKFYVDGVLVDTSDVGANYPITYSYNNSVMIGAEPYLDSTPSGYYFGGSIDDVRIYNYALSAQEVSELYSSAKTNYAQSPSKTGLIGYWNMDNESINGTTVYDSSENNLNGTSANTPTIVAGKIGQAMSFNGSTDVITFGNINRTMYTASVWFYNNDIINATYSTTALMGFQNNFEYSLAFGSATILLTNEIITVMNSSTDSPRSGWCDANASIHPGWHNLQIVWNGSYYDIYLDNELKTNCFRGTSQLILINDFVLGATHNIGPTKFYFNGKIDDVRIYNYALSAQEVAGLYNSSKKTYIK